LSFKDADGCIGGSAGAVKVSWWGHLDVGGGAWLRPVGYSGCRRLGSRGGGRDSYDNEQRRRT
jgi:hypothetical protein